MPLSSRCRAISRSDNSTSVSSFCRNPHSSPSTQIAPSSARSSWLMQRRKVLLPEPDGPTMQRTSLRSSASETPASAVNLPKRWTTSVAMTILGTLCTRLPGILVGAAAALAAREVPLEEILADREHRHDDEVPDRRDDQELHHARVGVID